MDTAPRLLLQTLLACMRLRVLRGSMSNRSAPPATSSSQVEVASGYKDLPPPFLADRISNHSPLRSLPSLRNPASRVRWYLGEVRATAIRYCSCDRRARLLMSALFWTTIQDTKCYSPSRRIAT